DLFEQHTVHFHGYPNASAFYDGVPDASIAINIGGSFTYYYLAPDAGTYFWHCHISPPEHLQMGMVGQIYVRPRQNRVATAGATAAQLLQSLEVSNSDAVRNPAANGVTCSDILCTGQTPAPTAAGVAVAAGTKFAYNDGDGSTRYDVEYPIQIHGFDPNFHFVGMTFNPESFTDMKDKYFLLNGRSYPDTVAPGTMVTQSTDGTLLASQPLPSVINIPVNGRALLRISDLDVTEYQTLASLAAVSLLANAAQAAAPGITGTSFALDAAAAYITQPDGSTVYSWGYGCTTPAAAGTFRPTTIAGGNCPTMQLPGPTLIVTQGQ